MQEAYTTGESFLVLKWNHHSSHRKLVLFVLQKAAFSPVSSFSLWPYFVSNDVGYEELHNFYVLQCSPLKVNRRFGRIRRLHLQGWILRQGRNQLEAGRKDSIWLEETWDYKETEGIGCHVPPKRPLTFNGLYGVMSENTQLFITIAVRTSNPAMLVMILSYGKIVPNYSSILTGFLFIKHLPN
jgi:hypothetical protein